MLESGNVFDGMSSVWDNACVNYDIAFAEVSNSSGVSTGNINCDVCGVQIRNISNNDVTGDNECTIPDVSTVLD